MTSSCEARRWHPHSADRHVHACACVVCRMVAFSSAARDESQVCSAWHRALLCASDGQRSRVLQRVSLLQVYSCSNDFTIKSWSADDYLFLQLYAGHTNFVRAVCFFQQYLL